MRWPNRLVQVRQVRIDGVSQPPAEGHRSGQRAFFAMDVDCHAGPGCSQQQQRNLFDPEPEKQRPFLPAFLRLGIEKIPLLLLAAAGACMTIYIHRKEGPLAGAMPLRWRLRNAGYSYLA